MGAAIYSQGTTKAKTKAVKMKSFRMAIPPIVH
jgi:hypothetical protein